MQTIFSYRPNTETSSENGEFPLTYASNTAKAAKAGAMTIDSRLMIHSKADEVVE